MKIFRDKVGERIYLHDGDILMYLLDNGKLYCYACLLRRRDIFGFLKQTKLGSKEEALKHLKEHIKAGHDVPKYAIERLEREINETPKYEYQQTDEGYEDG